MARIIWTEPALADLDKIAEYIAFDKLLAAKKLVKRVFSRVNQLAEFPLSGRKPPELVSSNYFEVLVDPCRIFYKIEKDCIYILYVMRSEQILRKYLIEERS